MRRGLARCRRLESGRAPSTRARALLLLGDIASTRTASRRASSTRSARWSKRVTTASCGSRSCWRCSSRSRRIRLAPVERADQAIELLRDGGDKSALARALIAKFIAEAVLGHGAQGHLLDEAFTLELDPRPRGEVRLRPGRRGGPVSVYGAHLVSLGRRSRGVRARFRELASLVSRIAVTSSARRSSPSSSRWPSFVQVNWS